MRKREREREGDRQREGEREGDRQRDREISLRYKRSVSTY